MTEITFEISRHPVAREFAALPGCEAWGILYPVGKGKGASGPVLARVHRDMASFQEQPAFTITTAAEPSHTLCTVVPQPVSARQQICYAVHDTHGRSVGQITHERSPHGMRQAWRIDDSGKQGSVVAYKGNVRGWVMYWALSPFWVFFGLLGFFHDGGRPSSFLWGKPDRASWRGRGTGGSRKAALGFKSGRYRGDTELLDANLIYAQAALYCG
ncbi:hypothetical protein [Streptomyces sp. NPDC048248]|uniref:hypothetical protein n=1 Tax=Streptomyces sp. NPDC048248 TaxID=3365523 RepID=UPI003715BD6A